jgi:hypothetical protein
MEEIPECLMCRRSSRKGAVYRIDPGDGVSQIPPKKFLLFGNKKSAAVAVNG